MIKLKELINETLHSCNCGGDCCSVNESKGMELGKIFTGHGFAFKNENLEDESCGYTDEIGIDEPEIDESELEESLYNVSQDMKDGKFDPKNPQVVIKGYGVTNLKTLQDSLSRKFIDLAKKAKKGDVDNLEYLLKRNGVLMGFVDALVDVNKQLNSSQMKRKITMYKRKH